MAFKVGQVTADVTADTSSFNRSMGMVRKKGAAIADNVTKSFREVGQKMRRIGVGMSAAISAPLVGVGSMALKTAADFESLRQSMDILNGSAEEGARNFERLKEFSAGTPFQLRGLAEAQNMLQGFGMTADDAFNSIKMIGDIAAVSGGDIKGIGIAFGQAAAEGRLMTRDIRQLINQGVPAIKLLADTMGVAQSDVLELASQGKISFEILQQSFRDATSEGGMFADGMQKQSQTLRGLFSTLKDNTSIALAEIGKSLSETFNIKDLITGLTNNIKTGIKWFGALSEQTRKTAFYIAGAIGAGGPVLVALGAMATALSGLVPLITALVSPVGLVIGAIGGLAAAITYVWDNWAAVKERISDINWWKNAILDMVKIFLEYNPIALIIDGFNALLSYFGQATIPNPFTGLSNELEGLRVDTKEYKHEFGSFTDSIKNAVNSLTGIDIGSIFSGTGGGDKVQETVIGIQRLSSSVREATVDLSQMKAEIPEVLSGLSLFEIATGKSEQALTTLQEAGMQFGRIIGDAFSQAVLHAKRLDDILVSVAKQLASRAIVTGLQILLTGGVGSMGFFDTLFGGFRAHGGPVSAGKGYVVGENGPEYFMPRSNGSIIPNGQMPSGGGMSEASMSRAFERALSRYVRGVSERQIFEMAEQGRYR